MILPSRLDTTEYKHAQITKVSAAVVGVGAIGTEIARLLGTLGVGNVTLIDPDVVESVNRTKSIFFQTSSDSSTYKTDSVTKQLKDYFPGVNWISHPQEIADVGFQDLADCTLLFSATDSTLSRVESAYTCRRLEIPMIDTGLLGSAYWCGRTSWFPAESGSACYLCLLSERKRAGILAHSHSLRQSCADFQENVDVPSTPTMSSVIAGMAIDFAFRICLPSKQKTAETWEVDLNSPPKITRTLLRQSSTCPFHQLPGRHTLVKMDYDAPLRSSFESLGLRAIELDWPIVRTMRCERCGNRLHPMKRLAWIRRNAICEYCHHRKVSPVELVERIAIGDQLSEYTPRDLSFSPRHLYTPLREV